MCAQGRRYCLAREFARLPSLSEVGRGVRFQAENFVLDVCLAIEPGCLLGHGGRITLHKGQSIKVCVENLFIEFPCERLVGSVERLGKSAHYEIEACEIFVGRNIFWIELQ